MHVRYPVYMYIKSNSEKISVKQVPVLGFECVPLFKKELTQN